MVKGMYSLVGGGYDCPDSIPIGFDCGAMAAVEGVLSNRGATLEIAIAGTPCLTGSWEMEPFEVVVTVAKVLKRLNTSIRSFVAIAGSFVSAIVVTTAN